MKRGDIVSGLWRARLSRLMLCGLLLLPMGVLARTPADSLNYVSHSSEYVEIRDSDRIAIDLRYATTNNFTGQNLYGSYNRAFLHRRAAEKLDRAAAALHVLHPDYRLLIFDALRPRSVQYRLWDRVKGTEQQKYVANPRGGSIHNYGFAVDLSIADDSGRELDMGTPFDDFTPLAQPRLEESFLAAGKLSEQQVQNRRLLRRVMEDAGFLQLPIEWWHFDALPKEEVRRQFPIVE